ncbi:MAG: type 2 lantipeptide synthetase LanM, partial [Symploca sp. SIO2E6]|nr:type 2 lantipeptide synthetase LanM [Symploca sp. SIO2E6]
FKYEASVFDKNTMNWPDYRDAQKSFMLGWCNGSPGVLLSRIGSIKIVQDEQIYKDIELSLEGLKSAKIQRRDNLCCGNFSIVESLLSASVYSHDYKLEALAIEKTIEIIQAHGHVGFMTNYSIVKGLEASSYNVSFFQGMSGIGYTLLRLVKPEQIPCLLLWE